MGEIVVAPSSYVQELRGSAVGFSGGVSSTGNVSISPGVHNITFKALEGGKSWFYSGSLTYGNSTPNFLVSIPLNYSYSAGTSQSYSLAVTGPAYVSICGVKMGGVASENYSLSADLLRGFPNIAFPCEFQVWPTDLGNPGEQAVSFVVGMTIANTSSVLELSTPPLLNTSSVVFSLTSTGYSVSGESGAVVIVRNSYYLGFDVSGSADSYVPALSGLNSMFYLSGKTGPFTISVSSPSARYFVAGTIISGLTIASFAAVVIALRFKRWRQSVLDGRLWPPARRYSSRR